MDVSRETFRTMLHEAICSREKFEREELEYTRDSGYLATMREMLAKTEREESTIHLMDSNRFSYAAEAYRDRKGS